MLSGKQKDTGELGITTTYFCEGGMVAHHRTRRSHFRLLECRLRLASLIAPAVLVHPGNILEEDAIYEMLTNNLSLLSEGYIKIAFPRGVSGLGLYAKRYEDAYVSPNKEAFYQSKKLTRSKLEVILHRANVIEREGYVPFEYDATGAREHFTRQVRGLVEVDFPGIPDLIRNEILELAEEPSPLGNIRTRVLDGRLRNSAELRRLARRINLAYFSGGASCIKASLCFNKAIGTDLVRLAHPQTGALVYDPVFSVTEILRDLGIANSDVLFDISSEDFSEIAMSPAAQKFKAILAEQVGSALQGASIQVNLGQSKQDFLEAYGDPLLERLRTRVRKEQRVSAALDKVNIGLQALSFVPVAGPVFGGLQLLYSGFAVKAAKARLTPILFTAERLKAAAGLRRLRQL